MYNLAQLPIEELRAQIGNGFILMILGMAIVFVFLTILVFSTKSVSKIVKKFEKETLKASTAKAPAQPEVKTAKVTVPVAFEGEIAAAIMAAVSESRK